MIHMYKNFQFHAETEILHGRKNRLPENYIQKIMPVGDLATQVARSSAGTLGFMFSTMPRAVGVH